MSRKLILVALALGCGGTPYTSLQGKCDLGDEKSFLLGWEEDLYLWYRELPAVDASKYSTAEDYFAQLRTQAKTATGHPKDKFHFTYPTAVWQQLQQSSTAAGYGISWAEFAQSPPRAFYVGFIEPGSAAEQAGIARGAKLLTVDGTDIVAGDPGALNAGLFPANAGESHVLGILDEGAANPRNVTLVSQVITTPSVRDATVVDGTVGYMNFNDHNAVAEQLLSNAFTQLKSQGITDLVLDLRYNGGGYLVVASEAAYMVSGKAGVFEREQWNDKHPELASTMPFQPVAAGTPFPIKAGTPLPHLDLQRVFILTNNQTCSASEAIINGLRGVDVQVVLIGSTTCGKPYGFIPQDNCGTTYFSIEFQGVNAKGTGDYADGFTPDCQVADDFTHALGDPDEGMLAAALQYRANGTCPAPSTNPEMKRGFDSRSSLRSALRGLRIVQ